jgi:calcineurin-like phosphoesterase family protein
MGKVVSFPIQFESDEHFTGHEITQMNKIFTNYLDENEDVISNIFKDLDVEETEDAIFHLGNKMLTDFLNNYPKEYIISAFRVGNIQYLMEFVKTTTFNHPIFVDKYQQLFDDIIQD